MTTCSRTPASRTSRSISTVAPRKTWRSTSGSSPRGRTTPISQCTDACGDSAGLAMPGNGAHHLTYWLINQYVNHMATDQLSKVFSALADPTRRDILTRLGEGDANVTELAAP